MTLPGETVATGARLEPCEFCREVPSGPRVMRSPAGFYLGFGCCLPFSRESGYYGSHDAAARALEAGGFER